MGCPGRVPVAMESSVFIGTFIERFPCVFHQRISSWDFVRDVMGSGTSRIGDQSARRLRMVPCRWRGASPSPARGSRGGETSLVEFSADALAASNRRTVGPSGESGFHRGTKAPWSMECRGERNLPVSGQPAIRVSGAARLNAKQAPRARGMQRESAASPLPSSGVIPRTACDHRYRGD